MNKIILDGREVKVGDKLWSCVYGWGEVCDIKYEDAYPIAVRFEVYTTIYTSDGRYDTDQLRTLFWNEIDITPPAPPKQKVKKWRWVVENRGGQMKVTDYHYKDEQDVDLYHVLIPIQKIDSTMIEVEE